MQKACSAQSRMQAINSSTNPLIYMLSRLSRTKVMVVGGTDVPVRSCMIREKYWSAIVEAEL